MVPPAPGLFSMITGWPRPLLMFSATVRAMMSVTLPAVKGTTILTGLFGYAPCAAAAPASRVAATRVRIRFMSCLLDCFVWNRCERKNGSGLEAVAHLDVFGLELEAGVLGGLGQQHREVDVLVAAA